MNTVSIYKALENVFNGNFKVAQAIIDLIMWPLAAWLLVEFDWFRWYWAISLAIYAIAALITGGIKGFFVNLFATAFGFLFKINYNSAEEYLDKVRDDAHDYARNFNGNKAYIMALLYEMGNAWRYVTPWWK